MWAYTKTLGQFHANSILEDLVTSGSLLERLEASNVRVELSCDTAPEAERRMAADLVCILRVKDGLYTIVRDDTEDIGLEYLVTLRNRR